MGTAITKEYHPSEGLDNLSHNFIVFCSILQAVVCIVGSAGNLLTVAAIVLCRSLRRAHNIYVAHLALVDLCICLLFIPFSIFGLNTKFIPGEFICRVIGAFALVCLVVSILNLFMIAVNRYMLICKGMHYYVKVYTKPVTTASLFLMWLWGIIVVLPLTSFGGLGWSKKTHFCFFINYNLQTYIYIVVVLANGGVLIPAAGATVCYMLIIKKLNRIIDKFLPSKKPVPAGTSSNKDFDSPENLDPTELNTSITFCHSNNPQTQCNPVTKQQIQKNKFRQKAHKKRITGLIGIFAIFLICWLPIALVFTADFNQSLPGWVYVLLISIAWINSSINAFVYAFTNRMYRNAFHCIVTCNLSNINFNFARKY